MPTTPSVVSVAAVGAVSAIAGCTPAPTASDKPRRPIEAVVLRTIDGDTLDVRLDDGRRWRVRLLGIDAPEATTKVECLGIESSRALARLVSRGSHVVLTFDPRGETLDRYRRRLAYVRDRDGHLVQLALLRTGHAAVYAYRGRRFVHRLRYERSQTLARRVGRGGWRACGPDFPHAAARRRV